MTVVIGSGGGGVMFHEACGHGLEADLVAKGASVFADRVGEQVASPLVTLVDDGTMGGEWGCFAIDDEGRPAQRNVLIEDGVLVDYMWDGLRARKAGRRLVGQRPPPELPAPADGPHDQHLPARRDGDKESIVADTDSGVYIAHLGGGQVNTATGDFVFGMTEAYLIEDGKITEPLREGNLIGNGPEVLPQHRRRRLRLRDGPSGHLRQGRPGRAGRRRGSDPAGSRPDDRRHGAA